MSLDYVVFGKKDMGNFMLLVFIEIIKKKE